MAQLDVQPKKHSSAWLLIIFIILAAAAAVLLYKGCNKSAPLRADTTDTLAKDTTKVDTNATLSTQPDWRKVDFNIPKSNFEEVTDTAVTVKSNDHYAIYSLSEDLLFKKGESKILPSANMALQQVVASVIKRYKDAHIGVYGHTDAGAGSDKANKSLRAARANAVKDWLSKQGRLPEDQLSVHASGDEQPFGDALKKNIQIVAFPDKEAQ